MTNSEIVVEQELVDTSARILNVYSSSRLMVVLWPSKDFAGLGDLLLICYVTV